MQLVHTYTHTLSLLLYPLDAVPLPLQVLLPQANLVVASADGQDVPAQTPAHPPQHGVEVGDRRLPLVRTGGVARPYPDRLVLRRRGDVGFLQHGGRPGHIPDPVGVAGEFFDGGVGLVLCAAGVS